MQARVTSKRDGMRFPCDLDAQIRGRGGVFTARAVNASRSGILFELKGPAVPGEAQLARAFRTGADLHFPEISVKVRADLARVAAGTKMLVAFRFRRNLDAGLCYKLGIEDRDDGDHSF